MSWKFFTSAGAEKVTSTLTSSDQVYGTVASASAIAVTRGNYLLTGTTAVNTVTGGVTGVTVTLIASGQSTGICVILNHATSTNNLSLRDSLNFGIYAGESVTFVFNGTYWTEISRNVRTELVYAEKTTNGNITSSGANGDIIATTAAVTMDGSTKIIVETFVTGMARGPTWISTLFAVDGATVYITGYNEYGYTGPATSLVRYLPSAASHTFGLHAKVDSGTGYYIATGQAPAFIRISRAASL